MDIIDESGAVVESDVDRARAYRAAQDAADCWGAPVYLVAPGERDPIEGERVEPS